MPITLPLLKQILEKNLPLDNMNKNKDKDCERPYLEKNATILFV